MEAGLPRMDREIASETHGEFHSMSSNICQEQDCDNMIFKPIEGGGKKKFCSTKCREKYWNRRSMQREEDDREKYSLSLEKVNTGCDGNYMTIGGPKDYYR